jgi:hypothetical protein
METALPNQPTQSAPQITPNPAVPSQPTPEAAAPPSTPKGPISSKLLLVVGSVFVLGIFIFGFLYVQSMRPATQEPAPAITPTEAPTPTPPPNLSRVATTSAFGAFGEEIASYAATLDAFSLQDSTLSPPILDLELGLVI